MLGQYWDMVKVVFFQLKKKQTKKQASYCSHFIFWTLAKNLIQQYNKHTNKNCLWVLSQTRQKNLW